MGKKPIEVEFSAVQKRRPPLLTVDEAVRFAEILMGLGLLCFALYCVHLFLVNNFG